MIRINLLAERKQKKPAKRFGISMPARGEAVEKKPAPFLTTLLLVVVGAVLVVGLLVLLLNYRVSQLRAEMSANQTQMSDLQKRILAVKQYEGLNKEIQKKKNLIETLRKTQYVPAQLLDDMTRIVPEGVWLTSLNYGNLGVTMEGVGFTNIDIVTLVENLKKSPNYSDVYLDESKRAQVEKVEVYNFKMNFRVKQ